MRQLQRLPLDKIYNILPEDTKQNKKLLSYQNGMGVAIGIDGFLFRHLGMAFSPFLVEDYRMGMIVRGQLRGIINLQEHTLQEGTIVFITPGTIVEPLEVSDDFLLEGMGLPADLFLMAHGGRLPELFNGQVKDGRRIVSFEERIILDRMLRLLHDLTGETDISKEVIYSMVSTVTHYYNQLFDDCTSVSSPSHSNEIFNRFLRLVNLHGSKEHQLAFYAEKLCITSRYLGTVVLATSGVGAKEWIDRAVISTAKVLLRHSDKQISEIADELNFPNVSFFCKYFKRLTGSTPQQYRKGRLLT
jgi:AraC family transcriptional activator of pobA